MTRITDGKGKTVAQFEDAQLAVRCIGPMARACGFALHIKEAAVATVADLPKNVTIESNSTIQEKNTITARP